MKFRSRRHLKYLRQLRPLLPLVPDESCPKRMTSLRYADIPESEEKAAPVLSAVCER